MRVDLPEPDSPTIPKISAGHLERYVADGVHRAADRADVALEPGVGVRAVRAAGTEALG